MKEDTWKKLFASGVVREFNSGEIIYYQDEPGSGLICLKEGQIKNSIIFPDGTEKILCFLDAPNITGETAIIDGGTSICSAIAVGKTKVVFIPRERAEEFLLSNPDLLLLTVKTMARKMRSMQAQAEDLAANIPQRLARMLLNCNKYGVFTHKEQEEHITITHDDLANFLGTTRPKITEHLNSFMKQGLIEKGRGYIIIKNYEGLKKLCHPG